MYSTSDFRNGLKIEINGDPYIIVDFQHVKPGKGGAFVRTRLKNLETGQVLDRTFKSGEKFNVPELEERKLQYLYKDDQFYHFMDTTTYEQVPVSPVHVGENSGFLPENIEVTALFYKDKPITFELPIFINLEIVETEPGVKGDTATGAVKPAKLKTGLTIQVPLFINEGDVVKIDTRTGDYIERVSS